jgi:hypothetical protein
MNSRCHINEKDLKLCTEFLSVNLKEANQMEYSGLVWVQYQRESKEKVQLSLSTPPTHIEGVQAQLHSLISAQDGGERSARCQGTPVPTGWAPESVWMFQKWEKSLSLTKNRTHARSLVTILTTTARPLGNITVNVWRRWKGMDWICVSQGRDRYCIVVNTVIKPLFHKEAVFNNRLNCSKPLLSGVH